MTTQSSELQLPLLGQGEVDQVEPFAETQSLRAGWLGGGVVFDHRRWRCRQAELRWVAPSHLIVVTSHGGTRRTRIETDDGASHDGADCPGVVSFIPAGTPRWAFYDQPDLTYTALWIDPALECASSSQKLPASVHLNARDSLLPALLGSLQADLVAGLSVEPLYVEHLIGLCLQRVAVLGAHAAPPPRHSKLSRVTMSRLEQFIDDHLGAVITLGALASVAGIGADSFARRFKATTGMSPYAFVLERRVQRAEGELARSTVPIADLAVRLGFANQSHFTSSFRRRRGTTPHAFRLAFA